MRRIVCLLVAMMAGAALMAQNAQDFASKFMTQCEEDTAVHCVTVGPKMMEQLTRQPDTARDDNMAQAIQKLKSARIVTASTRGEEYFQMAEELLKKNPQRFSHNKSYRNNSGHGTFYTRKTRNGDTVELIMLHATPQGTLVIVNLTGDIDDEFINSLTKTFGGRTAKAYRQQAKAGHHTAGQAGM